MKLLKKVDNYKEFLTCKELNEQLKSLCEASELLELGESDGGHSILGVKIGTGKESALIFGFPHPNEPVGSLTCLNLIKLLRNNKELFEKFTWYIVPCADPDGAKLNEGWFKGQFTIKKYAHHFYRTESSRQTDWTFPVTYKGYTFNSSPKNTQALSRLIDKVKPKVIYPLHNAGFGGAYFFITQKVPEEFCDKVINLCNKLSIPLDMGEPEIEYMKVLKKPIYGDVSFQNIFDYFEKQGKDPKKILTHGQSSLDYASEKTENCFVK